MDEVWTEIVDYPNYQVSNFGNVKNVKRNKYLKPDKDKDGYLNYKLYNNGESKTFKAHRLVALNFIQNTQNKPHVNHIDGVKTNNNVENLEWVTQQENERHKYDVLKYTPSEKAIKSMAEKLKIIRQGGNNPSAKQCTIIINGEIITKSTKKELASYVKDKFNIANLENWFTKKCNTIPSKYKEIVTLFKVNDKIYYKKEEEK